MRRESRANSSRRSSPEQVALNKEHWGLWTAEDQWVARASLRARIRELRSHPAAVIWANGSDGLPPDPVLNDYREILRELHWQSAAVDTVSNVNRSWSGIHMVGPYGEEILPIASTSDDRDRPMPNCRMRLPFGRVEIGAEEKGDLFMRVASST